MRYIFPNRGSTFDWTTGAGKDLTTVADLNHDATGGDSVVVVAAEEVNKDGGGEDVDESITNVTNDAGVNSIPAPFGKKKVKARKKMETGLLKEILDFKPNSRRHHAHWNN